MNGFSLVILLILGLLAAGPVFGQDEGVYKAPEGYYDSPQGEYEEVGEPTSQVSTRGEPRVGQNGVMHEYDWNGDGLVIQRRTGVADFAKDYGLVTVHRNFDGLVLKKTDANSDRPDGSVYFIEEGCTRFNKSTNTCEQRGPEDMIMSVGGHWRPSVYIRNARGGKGRDSQALIVENDADWSTVHLENKGGGQVIWMENQGAGDFIVAHSVDRAVFRVDNAGVTTTRVLEVTGADLAEGFEVTTDEQLVLPGTVVSIDPSSEGKMVPSRNAYDPTVAGVISGAGGIEYGMMLGASEEHSDAVHPVALSGRVRVRCDASAQPIVPGDLLTTSSVPGHCMKVTDHDRARGAILGKAMSKLESGTGLVLTLISLQ